LVIDEWVEKIPSKKIDAAIAFHCDSPNSEAPQSLLLAVISVISTPVIQCIVFLASSNAT
jgi:hypothetical protein